MAGVIKASTVSGNIPDKVWPFADGEEPMLYRGHHNVTAGPSGVGKSMISLRRAAEFSRDLGPVLYCNAEDALMIQRMRFEACNANMDNVLFGSFKIPDNLGELEETIVAHGIVLVVFDTAADHFQAAGRPIPMQYWGMHLERLQRIIEEAPSRPVCDWIHHTNKNVKKNSTWQNAIGGPTQGLPGKVRTAQLVGRRPDQEDQVVTCPCKDSYDAPGKAIAYEYDKYEGQQADGKDVEVSYMRQVETGVAIADPVMLVVVQGQGGKRGPTAEVAAAIGAFFAQYLANGPMPVKDTQVCVASPDGAEFDVTDSNGLVIGKRAGCGHQNLKVSEANGGCCPDCGGPTTGFMGLESYAELDGIAWSSVKKVRASLGIVTSRKGGGRPPGQLNDSVPWNALDPTHPDLTPGAPTELP